MREHSCKLRRVQTELSLLLSRYTPDSIREQEFVTRMQALLGKAEPFSRNHFAPGHFTASAFIVSPERDALLLIFHKKLQLWLQPGGHLDLTDSSVLAGAIREAEEEVGLSELSPLLPEGTIFDVDIHAIPGRKSEPAHEHFDVRFAFVAPTRAARANAEVSALRWVDLADVGSVTSDASVVRAAAKLRALR